ncbi:tripartite tricarboxylate transporter permease [Candidatus Micrarchaeota archaeon]|nr:tripartite tricarboxylate transporter permease [Candidatus Micrarchaeota archaeon]
MPWGMAGWFIIGIILGCLTGMLPGLHSNTLISILSEIGIDETSFAILIIAIYPANLIVSFIPSIFLGIPEDSTVIAVLPGQRMVLKGKGLLALKTILLSSVFAALVSIVLFYPSLGFFPIIYGFMRPNMKYILLLLSIILLAKTKKPHLSLLIFLLAGALGYLSLNSEMKDPFLPMFSGMFAITAMINYGKRRIPEQKDTNIDFGFLKFSFLGVLLGFFSDLIPGIGSPSQVAVFATIFMPMNTLGYLATISSISISQAIFSLSSVASINKARVGAIIWLSDYIDIEKNLALLLPLFLIGITVSVFIVYLLRRKIGAMASLDLKEINWVLAAYLIIITFLLNGIFGVVILVLGSILGLVTTKMKIERTNLMGAIIVPTLILLF